VADEGRPDWIIEKRSHRPVRALAFEKEDDLGLGQEDGVSVEGGLELLGAERRVLGEKAPPLADDRRVSNEPQGRSDPRRQAYFPGLWYARRAPSHRAYVAVRWNGRSEGAVSGQQ
jgi:hypothetical protein